MVQRILRLLIVAVMALLTASHGLPAKGQQANPSSEDIDQIIEQMSVEEKVGQLFMVELFEPATGLGPDIQELIQDYKVGAVILIARNDNFSNTETELGSTPLQVANLTTRLQTLAYEGSIDTDESTFYAPLLIAVDHEGDGWPYTRIREGATDIPSSMAIGATWSEESAAAIGAIVGQEMDAMGVNMLLGPVIDVLHQQSSAEGGDQGVRLMSASPFWVGKLGRAYIRGVHEGSNNQVTTVAKHFPGHGRSDRLPDEEVSFLDVSLDELRHSDLIPFFMVTEHSEQDPAGVTDAIMSSHIQYELSSGQKSGPVSLVPGAMESVLGMPELDDWRSSGLILADALGAIAVQKYYQFEYGEPAGTFNHRRVAMDAFMAGNDLLMLVDYAALGSDRAERYRVMKDTIRYFQDEYPTNSIFRERVDAVLRKILRLKLRLYPNLSYAEAQIDLNRVEALVGTDLSEKQVGDVAEAAITLVAGQSGFRPPQKQDNILIVTDSYRPPFGDPPTPPLTTDQIEQTILALYGPSRSGLVDPVRITSWSFDEMAALLEASGEGSVVDLHGKCRPPESVELVDRAPLDNADWIIFAMPDLVRCGQGEKLVTAFLRSNLLRPDHKVVVFALGAPYYLDSTDVNKLTAYYGVYSKVPPFIEVAVRALFGEVDPHRAPPVDIGKSYVLDDQLRPDPAQPWGIRLVTPLEAGLVLEGDEKIFIEVQTSQLLDRNKNVVPDGTPVIFRLLAERGTLLGDWKVETEDGVARLEVPLAYAGNLSLQAIPDGFTRGEGKDLSIRVQEPTPTPTSTSLPTNTPIPTPIPTPVPLPTTTPTPAPTSTPLPPDEPQELVTPVNSLWELLSSPGGADTIVGGIIVTLIAGLLTGSAAVLFRLVTKRRKK